MKLTLVIAHLCIPGLVAVGGYVAVLKHESLGIDTFATVFIVGYLFYAAPHLWWTIVARLGHFSDTMWHAGYVASSIALAAIAAFWFLPGDRSGLAMQWLRYWPLAIILQVVSAGVTALLVSAKTLKCIVNPSSISSSPVALR